MNTNTPTQTPSLTWSAPRAANHERSRAWYIAGGIVVIASTVFGLIAGIWTLSIVCILCGALYFLVRDHRFPDIECMLNDKGAQIGDTFLAWTQIKGYWFVTTPTFTELHITPAVKRVAEMVIQTGPMTPMDIRSFLAGKTNELIDKQESFLDILLRITKL